MRPQVREEEPEHAICTMLEQFDPLIAVQMHVPDVLDQIPQRDADQERHEDRRHVPVDVHQPGAVRPPVPLNQFAFGTQGNLPPHPLWTRPKRGYEK